MISVARKNLFAEKTRLAISVGGVAFSVLLILMLTGLYQGWSQKMGAYVEAVDTDIWVAQSGTGDMFHSVSIIDRNIKSNLEKISGVGEVQEFIGRRVTFKINGEEKVFYLVGIDANDKTGGPAKIISGKKIPDLGEIIIDEVFAKENNLKLDGKLILFDQDFVIKGIASGGNMGFFQYAFFSKQDARKNFKMENFANYFLVKTESGQNISSIQDEIKNKIPLLTTFTKTKFVEENKRFLKEAFIPILSVLVGIGFVVGVSVIGLTIYTSTIEKAREFGVLKAIGATNWQLYKIIFSQSFYAGIIGYLVGIGLAFGSSYFITRYEPRFITFFRPYDLGWIFIAAILMSLLAAYLPLRRIASIDPAQVFKS